MTQISEISGTSKRPFLHEFFEKGGGVSTSLTEFCSPKDLVQMYQVSRLFKQRVSYQFLLFIKPSKRDIAEAEPLKSFKESPEDRVNCIGCDEGGKRRLQRELNVRVRPYIPVTKVDLFLTIERIEQIASHIKNQTKEYPAQIFNLRWIEKFAVENLRVISELKGLNVGQIRALAIRLDLTPEDVKRLRRGLFGNPLSYRPDRLHLDDLGPSYILEGLRAGLSIDQVNQEWFRSSHARAALTGRKYEEFQGLHPDQAQVLVLRPDLTREDVGRLRQELFDYVSSVGSKDLRSYILEGLRAGLSIDQVNQEWFSSSHAHAALTGRKYEEFQGLRPDQAHVLALVKRATREDVERTRLEAFYSPDDKDWLVQEPELSIPEPLIWIWSIARGLIEKLFK